MTSTTPESVKEMADRGIPIADLSIISLARLRQADKAEKALLEDAASTTGFFFLDFRGDTAGDRMLANLPGLFSVAEKYFTQPEEIKSEDVRLDISDSQDLGWKKGNGAESFEVGTLNQSTHIFSFCS